MKLALSLAARGAGWVSPNPMVGAVVVKDGQVVGRGYHRRAGAPHAEVEALPSAGEAARGADLYVTLEPCNHQGRTPPCTQAILAAGVRRVIIAARDPNPQVTGGGAEFLTARGVEVDVGLLAAEARRLNEAWLHYVNTGRPWVIAKAACSLDGKIATVGGESQWLTGEAARAPGAPPAAPGGRHRRGDRHGAGRRPPTHHPAAPGPGQRPHPGRPGQPAAPAPDVPAAAPGLRRPHLGGHHQPGADGDDPRP